MLRGGLHRSVGFLGEVGALSAGRWPGCGPGVFRVVAGGGGRRGRGGPHRASRAPFRPTGAGREPRIPRDQKGPVQLVTRWAASRAGPPVAQTIRRSLVTTRGVTALAKPLVTVVAEATVTHGAPQDRWVRTST